jgi:hypothetical protein
MKVSILNSHLKRRAHLWLSTFKLLLPAKINSSHLAKDKDDIEKPLITLKQK